jgi:hypothetical protein
MTTAAQVFAARLYYLVGADPATGADGGYSQPHRYDVQRTRGVTTPGFVFECDCSSLTLEGCVQAGIPIGSATYTGDMRAALTAVGWTAIPYAAVGADPDNLCTGDLALSEAVSGGVGHVAGVIGPDLLAEAWIDGRGDIMGSAEGDGPGDDTGGETRAIAFSSHPYTVRGLWTHILRPPALDAATADAEPTPTTKGLQTMFGITYTAARYGGVTAYVLITESAGADALDRVQAQVYNSVLPNGFIEVPEHHAEMLIREAWERHNRVAARAAADVRVDIDEATQRVLAAVKEGDNK